jgi:hypothetical protein
MDLGTALNHIDARFDSSGALLGTSDVNCIMFLPSADVLEGCFTEFPSLCSAKISAFALDERISAGGTNVSSLVGVCPVRAPTQRLCLMQIGHTL